MDDSAATFLQQLRLRVSAADASLAAMHARHNEERRVMAARHAEEQVDLTETLEALGKIIEVETKANAIPTPKGEGDTASINPSKPPLADFIVRQFKYSSQLSKEDIRKKAQNQGYFEPNENGGRAIHATMLNLVRTGRVEECGGEAGVYRIPSPGPRVPGPLYDKEKGPVADPANEPL